MNGSKELHKIPLPLVSIVTPSYNSYPYIQETVESVQVQDYPHIEHIVIDGGSTDGTAEFLQQQDHLIWISEPDRGQSHALNKGFRRARGEIIGWLNADDTYQPGAVSLAVRYLQSHPEVDLIYSDLQIIDETSISVGIAKAKPFAKETLIFSNYVNQPTVFMSRRVMESLGGIDERLDYVMDREFWLRAGMAGFKMHYLENQVLANFRLIPGTKSFEKTPHFRVEWLDVLEDALIHPSLEHIPLNTKKYALRKTRAQYHLAQMIEAIEVKNRRHIFQYLWQAAKQDPTLLTNRGTWYFLTRGLLGLNIDPLKKFKKNAFV